MFRIIGTMDMFLFLSALFFLLAISQVLINRYFQGLTDIPGPWLASTTNLWRLFVTLSRRGELTHMKLHRKYGDVVRMGPNFVSITDLETVRKIFSSSGEYRKVSLIANGEHNANASASPTCIQSSRQSPMERDCEISSTSQTNFTILSLEDQ